MRHTPVLFLATFGLLACTTSGEPGDVEPTEVAARAADPVFVVNGAGAPVPTRAIGPTTVEGTVTVDNQSLNVNGAVAITNAELLVRQVPTQVPWQLTGNYSIPIDTTSNDVLFYTVPAGKRLVVEYADSVLKTITGGTQGLGLVVQDGGVETSFVLPLTHSTVGDDLLRYLAHFEYRGAQMMRLYAGPGATITIHADRNNPVGTAAGRLTMAGYLVDAP